KIHDLEDQLFRLKRSYRELSQENERLRKELGHKEEFGPYAILGVTPGSDWTAIKQAYIRLSQKHHPDKGGDEGQMQKITEAYTELKLIYS
ncbi:MAG: DnaJ domain-containing protein, partial [Myxococcota bacterium]|nr:DnaJ domain-containing protein [Myxococcota bacterium]